MKKIVLIAAMFAIMLCLPVFAADEKISTEVATKISQFEKLGLVGGTPQTFVGKVLKSFMGVVGTIAFVMFVYGGITWMLAGGDSTKVSTAKSIFIWSSLGLVIIFASYALVSYIINALSKVG